MVTWIKIFKPHDSAKKLSQMVLSQVTGNPDGNISGPKGPRGTRGNGDISETSFLLF